MGTAAFGSLIIAIIKTIRAMIKYIQTAIFGYHFCKAAKCAFFLILRNIARIMALSIVSGFVLLLGKLVITAGATFLCYVCLAYTPVSEELNYIWLPLVF